ncbi:serine/threonine-protein kinase [Streptomyces alfalfae]|uniref:serine/threonine-protein kinase n=1 Tax=Streptomyces alfalfae TaxID=1642299 RepID=UPI0009A2317C|nr:serine/threonine-protein kinase [Streptomyces alfalfae]AYA17199.1 serine/threonine protein kinase [Streptomyces fradiae]QUI33420.1 serine/threonine protein kinase [Streptomyces alfalfae]
MGSLGDHAGAAGAGAGRAGGGDADAVGDEGNARVIAGRYRLDARLGRGGMGTVWRATDLLLGRQVAVKELDRDETLSDTEAAQQRERTLREARAVAQLRHPHIVVVHDVVEHAEQPYIVMELIEGGSLARQIGRTGPLDAQTVARMGIDLLGALSTAHEAGILHRDLKPANVLVERAGGRVVLTDFGIAQVSGATTLTEVGSFVGSPEYTAPERIAGERTGPASDLWSLGALLVTALAGESPFRRDSIGGVLHAVIYEEIRPPERAAPLLPVVSGLLERDPRRRLDAAGAERLLQEYVDTGRMSAPPDGGSGAGRDGAGHGRLAGARRVLLPKPGPALGPRGRQRRAVLITAALVAAVTGGAVSATALLLGRDGDDGKPANTASPTSTTATPSPTVTVTEETPSPGPSTPQAPAGYRLAKDPEGFEIAVPRGFVRRTDGTRVFYASPSGTYRVGIKEAEPEPGGPLAVQRRADDEGPRTNPGYRNGEVTETTRNGRTAALWEFIWDDPGNAGGERQTYDLCWQEGGTMYDVWVSGPAEESEQVRKYFDTAVDTFVRRR